MRCIRLWGWTAHEHLQIELRKFAHPFFLLFGRLMSPLTPARLLILPRLLIPAGPESLLRPAKPVGRRLLDLQQGQLMPAAVRNSARGVGPVRIKLLNVNAFKASFLKFLHSFPLGFSANFQGPANDCRPPLPFAFLELN